MVLALIPFISGGSDDRNLYQHADIIKLILSTVLCVFLTGSAVYADTLTIAVTSGTLDVVDTIARSFETAYAGDKVQIGSHRALN